MTDRKYRNAIPPGERIGGYLIEKVLGQGGFGITYLARDDRLERQLAIKEYFPAEFCRREADWSVSSQSEEAEKVYAWGLERFLVEGKTLAKFKHPNIVRVIDYLEQNNTAYIVMEYEQGRDLQDMLKQKKTLSPDELLKVFLPLLDGLALVHKAGFIHRDIKPANIFIRRDGSPVLIDFGSARQGLTSKTRTLTTLVSPGYAPFEQYNTEGAARQGPWTDIYALGASMYRSLFGRSPPDALARAEQRLAARKDIHLQAVDLGKGHYPVQLLGAIDSALAFLPEDRPQNIDVWLELLKATTVPQTAPDDYIETIKIAVMDGQGRERTGVVPVHADPLEQPGLRLPITKYVVFGLLTMWAYTSYTLSRNLSVLASSDYNVRISNIPGYLFSGTYLLVMAMVLSWTVPNLFMGQVFGEAYIVKVVFVSSLLFYLNTLVFVLWYMKQLKRIDLYLVDEQLKLHDSVQQQDRRTRNDMIARWESIDNHVVLFLVISLPIIFSPFVSARMFYNNSVLAPLLLLPVIVLVLGGVFHVWGTRLLVNNYNRTLIK